MGRHIRLLETSTWGLFRNATDGTCCCARRARLIPARATVLAASSSAPGGFVVDDTHRFDQLPSNDVTAVAADWWGLHIATESGTMTHWNALSEEFEEGLTARRRISGLNGSWPTAPPRSDDEQRSGARRGLFCSTRSTRR